MEENMQKKLKEVAQVYSGASSHYFHKTDIPGSMPVELISADNLSSDGTLNLNKTTKRWVENPFPIKFFLEIGDILVQMRGSVFKASLITERCPNTPLSVNSNIAIVRLKSDKLLPEVVCFFLNSVFFQKTTIKQTQSNIVLINLKALGDVMIDSVDAETQQQLRALYYADLELTKTTLALLQQQHAVTEAKFFDLIQSKKL